MQQLPPFSGTGVAIVTPFSANGTIDFPALGQIIDHVIAGAVDYIVALGSTGEAATLSNEEAQEVINFTLKKTQGKSQSVVGHFASNNTAQLSARIRNFDCSGLAGIMSASPAYNKPSQEGIFQHFQQITRATDLPIIIYNVPGRTASNILPETVLRLAQSSPQFAAVKEASGDLNQIVSLLRDCPPNFAVLSGDDPTALPTIAAGGHGSISVIANAYPAQWSAMIQAALNQDFVSARQLNFDLWGVHPSLYVEGNPTGLKAALAQLGLCQNQLRLPLVPMSEAGQKELFAQMDRVPELVKLR